MAEKSKKIVQIEIETNAGKATKEFEQLSNGVLKAADSAEKLDASFDDVYNGMAPLTTRMGEAEDRLYELALAGDTASKEYQELLTKVGEYRKVQIQTDLAVDGAATTMTQKLGSALNGATSGFAATQGAMALFGDENQALEESLLKVQSALAIQQGVQGLTEAYRELSIGTKIAGAAQAAFTFVTGGATTAMKLFRLALISTGVGAIVVALGMLIANFDKLSDAMTGGIDGFKKMGVGAKLLMLPLLPLIATIDLVKKGMQSLGLMEKDEDKEKQSRHEADMKRIADERAERERSFQARQQQFDREIAMAEALGESSYELRQQKQKDFIQDQKLLLQGKEAAMQGYKNLQLLYDSAEIRKEINEAKQRYLDIEQSIADAENQIAINTIKNNQDISDSEEDKTNKYIEYAKERLRIARQIEDIENGLLKDGIEKELEINRDKFRRLREDAIANTKLTTKERATLIDLRNQEESQAEAKIIADNQKRREDAFETERSDRVELLNFVDELNTAEVESEKAKNLAILDNAVETNEKLIESDKAVAEAKKNIQDAQMANIEAGISLLKDVAGENNKLQALAIAAESAVSIAETIITTQAANAAATAQGAALGITTAGASVAAATALVTQNNISAGISIAAQIAAAAKGISALGGGASAPSGGNLGGGGASSAAVPNFNVVGDSSINQIAQLQQQPTQAYVVSGEVTTSQALDRNRVQNATL